MGCCLEAGNWSFYQTCARQIKTIIHMMQMSAYIYVSIQSEDVPVTTWALTKEISSFYC